ncbi:hypothetical protein TL16_g02142 [Triparma laevis f. inornata]|uniref:Aldehyde dehydrogenase n=2 Tax=Triparma laevis TaxID=1534972 RepID=A0A9W7FQK2_9STRA|nr:hypothetical protein TL16_g02142 [Triparma laevis f. inornata]GMI16497.1 hypothetical protein TrLO_g12861 [Triparma laevis f. longispina]
MPQASSPRGRSRGKSPGAKKAAPKNPEAQVPSIVAELRKNFDNGVNKSYESRIRNLEGLRTVLVKGKAKLCEALRKDLGKCEVESYYTEMNLCEHEIQHMVDHLKSYMAPQVVGTDLLNIGGASRIYPDPLGVVCVIGAWNYPVQLTLMPCVGAIAAGNVCFIKVPSDKYTNHTSRALAELCEEHLDQDVFRLVEGAREMTGAVLRERYDKIFFTGGCFVGKMVAEAAAKHLTPTVLELGGKSPVFVTESADLTIAARRICWGAFMNCGQTCVRPDYCMVDEKVASKFFEEVEKCCKQFYTDTPKNSEFFGRVINERAAERLEGIIEGTPKSKIRFGGDVDVKDKFVAPTLLDFGTDFNGFKKSAAMADEIFGPILPAVRYTNLQDAIGFVNENEKPLSCYLFTTNSTERESILTKTTAGSANVNDVMMHMCNPNLPFGGVGKSGMGRYHGKFSFDCFTHYKSVLFKSNFGDVWARYPPYDSLKVGALGVVQSTKPGWVFDLIKYAVILAIFLAVREDDRCAKLAHKAIEFVLE